MSKMTSYVSPQSLGGHASVTRSSTQQTNAPRLVSYSTPSIHAIRRLLRSYDVDQEVDGMLYHRGVNDTFFLCTRTQQFALKLYHAGWRTHDEVNEEVTATRYCGQNGVNVAMPIERRDGAYVSSMRAPEGTRWAVLFPWAQGDAPSYAEAGHIRQFGRVIGQMHEVMANFPSRSVRPKLNLNYLLRNPVEQIKSRLERLPAIAKRLETLHQRIESRLTRIDTASLPWGFCHGDVYIQNARYDGERLVLFDFDFCGQGWQIFDLATLSWHARRECAGPQAWSNFHAGYLEVRPNAAPSLPAIEVFMMIRHLWNKAHVINYSMKNGRVILINEPFLEDAVAYCEKLEAEHAPS